MDRRQLMAMRLQRMAMLREELEALIDANPLDLGFEESEEGQRAIDSRLIELENEIENLQKQERRSR